MEPSKSQRSDCQPGGSKRSAQDPSSSVDTSPSSSTAGQSGSPCWKKFKPAAVSAWHGSFSERAANSEATPIMWRVVAQGQASAADCRETVATEKQKEHDKLDNTVRNSENEETFKTVGAGCVQSKLPTGPAKRKAAGGLADLEGAKGSFTGAAIDYRLPCTAAEDDGMCQIVGQLSTWNEFLCKAHLELREMPGTRSQLSLSACLRTGQFDATKEELHQAVTLVYWLLRTHRCVAVVDVPHSLLCSAHSDLLSSALQDSSSVKSLTFRLPCLKFSRNSCKVVFSLTQLEAFECVGQVFRPQASLKTALVLLLQTTSSLTCLRIPKLSWRDSREVWKFVVALEANSTLKELSVNDTLIEKASRASNRVLENYIRNSKTLTTLTVMASEKPFQDGIYWLFTGIGVNDTLSEVNLVGFYMDYLVAASIAACLKQSKCLRSFNMIGAQPDSCTVGAYPKLYSSWCELFTQIEALDEVTLPMCALMKEQWPPFFNALAKNTNLRHVTIEVDNRKCAVTVEDYVALKESGAADKVLFKYASDPHAPLYSAVAFRREGLSELYIGPGHEPNRERLSSMIHELPLCTNITSVILDVHQSHWDDALFSAFSHYVESTTALRKLRVAPVHWYALREPDATTTRFWMLLLCSLGQNKSVTELCAETCIDEGVAKELADVIKTSPNIRRVHVKARDHLVAVTFIRGLSVAIADNYRLTDVTLEDKEPITDEGWFAIRSVAARNSSLVTRAAQYVCGAPFSRYRAQALERVSRSPSLMEEVAELASISNSEATSRVRGGLRRFEGLHDFMRLCGVVSETVVCHVRQDGRMQLDKLNEDCWNRVRDYLWVEDVGESTVLRTNLQTL